jgi:hypothetical protein
MPRSTTLLFIDAQQYLDLFRTVSGHKLLRPLKTLRDRIFVTEQVADEVRRNKVRIACEFLTEQFNKVNKQTNFGLPSHLFGETEESVQRISAELDEIVGKIKKLNEGLAALAHDILGRISRSEDEVSVTLEAIFDGAVRANDTELRRAEHRKIIGNPPGKKVDPIGDELTWEQILGQCPPVNKLWLLTRDTDYISQYGGRSFLNAFLTRELKNRSHSIEIFCFDNVPDGLKHFTETTHASTEGLPTEKEAEEIKKEQAELDTVWMTLASPQILRATDERLRELLMRSITRDTLKELLFPRICMQAELAVLSALRSQEEESNPSPERSDKGSTEAAPQEP